MKKYNYPQYGGLITKWQLMWYKLCGYTYEEQIEKGFQWLFIALFMMAIGFIAVFVALFIASFGGK